MSIPLNQTSIVVPVTSKEDLEKISGSASQPPWDIIELRIDSFSITSETCREIAANHTTILTCRHPDEGGDNGLYNSEERNSLLAPLIPHVAGIDIEIAHVGQMEKSINLARQSDVTVILSAHDFASTPDLNKLHQTIEAGIAHCADVIKIATTTETPEELCRLLSLFESFPQHRISLMGMGKLGMASRLAAAQCGSILNYAALNAGNAPGQWPVEEFHDLLCRQKHLN